MEIVPEIIRNTLPSAVALYGVYMIIRAFLNKQLAINLAQNKSQNDQLTLKLRLQAYERMILYIERMMPNNLIPRLNGTYTADEFRHILLHHIKEEYDHNISQQIYLSSEIWEVIKRAKEELIVKINETSRQLPEGTSAVGLSKKLLEAFIAEESNALVQASLGLKEEVRHLF